MWVVVINTVTQYTTILVESKLAIHAAHMSLRRSSQSHPPAYATAPIKHATSRRLDLVLRAGKTMNVDVLQFESNVMQDDRNTVLNAVAQDGLELQFASMRLQNDVEVVLAAVQQNGMALEYASDASKATRGIVLAAVRQNGRALRYASHELQHDVEILAIAMANM